jgi:erythronate-4-phosphate dehydrogenase
VKVVIDSAIPFLKGIFEPYAKVVYLPGINITSEDVRDADAMIIRTRTRCDAELLRGSSVQMIATATIGFDHIDLSYCRQHRIEVATAAGCNARGVLQWFSAVANILSQRGAWIPNQKTLGVIGVGHVGSLVCQYASQWGFRVLACDPPRAAREGGDFVPYQTIVAECDVVTFHTPLNETTCHMANQAFFEAMRPGAIVINSSRGEVVDGQALLSSGHPYVLDVWEHEPAIDKQLLAGAQLATPHIAGYSLQGKANASSMAVHAIARHFGWPLESWYPKVEKVFPKPITWQELQDTIALHYDILADCSQLRAHPEQFEKLRNEYCYREEYF